jgi:tryptophanyl-tRNA synthetase
MVEKLAPIRARAQELTATPERVDDLLAQGAEKARTQARETIDRAHELIGLMPPPSRPVGTSHDI